MDLLYKKLRVNEDGSIVYRLGGNRIYCEQCQTYHEIKIIYSAQENIGEEEFPT